MRNELEIKTDIYLHLKASELATNILGVISKTLRPNESDKEDIVISVLSDPSNQQIEEVYINVNVYVPDLKRKNQYEENTIRLNELCKLSLNALRIVSGKGYRMSLATQKIFDVPGKNEHFINNKVLYQICNE